MTSRLARTLLVLLLAALTAPAAASATTPVAPPGSETGSLSAAAKNRSDPGCRLKGLIAFKGSSNFLVRQAARARCTNVRVRTRCNANLLQGGERIAEARAAGLQRCRAATPFSASERHPEGTEFTQRYRFKLKLMKRSQSWTGTTDECPKLSKNERTLTCRGSHTTVAPEKSVDRILS